MTSLILVIITASQATTKCSGFSNRTLVIWVMNLQFWGWALAEIAVSAPLHQLGGMTNIWKPCAISSS